jgi:hypothetical protein
VEEFLSQRKRDNEAMLRKAASGIEDDEYERLKEELI